MINKRTARLIVCVALILLTVEPILAEEEEGLYLRNYLINMNETIDNGILPVYFLSEVESYFYGELGFDTKIEALGRGIARSMPPELLPDIDDVCQLFDVSIVRYNRDVFYSVLQIEEGGRFYIFWRELTPAHIYPYTVKYIAGDLDINRFEFIPLNSTEQKITIEEVYEVDPCLETNIIFSAGLRSYSLLKTGDYLAIRYVADYSLFDDEYPFRWIVEDVKIVDVINTHRMFPVFEDDLPNQNKE